MEQLQLENRPYPYLVTDANLLKQVKQSAAEGLFKSFQLLVGKDVREGNVRFEALLGVYTNAIQFVKLLETSLAVSCINTEFKDLKRMVDGKIQFKISVPTIAYGDGRRPNKQKQYIIMKSCNKHNIAAEIELSTMDLEILFTERETMLDFTEYMGALKTVTSSLHFGVDALERGLIDTVLNVKLRHAPPTFILKTLTDPTFTERGLKKGIKSDLLSMFKNHLLENSFFLDRAEGLPRSKQYVLTMLSDMIGATCGDTVFKGNITYSTASGEPISGVLETTDNVLRKLLNILGETESSIYGPAAYASYVVRGENLVTALSYGKVMRNFDHFMARLVEGPNIGTTVQEDSEFLAEESGTGTKTQIASSVIKIGSSTVALESLQRVYHETQNPFPLNRRMHFTYYFPVGLHLPDVKYTTSTSIRGIENPHIQSMESWIVNKNNTVLCFNFQSALKSICHPRFHNPVPCVQELQHVNPEPVHPENRGVRLAPSRNVNLHRIMYDAYRYPDRNVPEIAVKASMNTDTLLQPVNHSLLQTELHPLFDVYVDEMPGAQPVYRATHRTMVGNLPQALAPHSFQDARGAQFEAATGLSHVADNALLDIVRETAFDSSYPVFCYMIEAMIHGQEEKFLMNTNLIALVINTYWNNSGRLAFVNSFWMVYYISIHMGNGIIPKEVFSYYRRIIGELSAIEQALIRYVGNEPVMGEAANSYVSALLDQNLLPPFIYKNIFNDLLRVSRRDPEIQIGNIKVDNGNKVEDYVRIIPTMQEAILLAADIYRDRNEINHGERFMLDVGNYADNGTLVMEKIFYYVFLPVCAQGHLCGMGVDFDNLSLALTYNAPVYAEVINGGDNILHHLENGTLRDALIKSDIRPTVDMLRRLSTSYITCPYATQFARISSMREPGQDLATHDSGKRVAHTVLVNGIVAFSISEGLREVVETMFYAVPFHKLYSDPLVAGTISPIIGQFVTMYSSQRDILSFATPPQLVAEYEEWHKSPILAYISKCEATCLNISAVTAMHLKMSPVAFIYHSKNKVHPGFALTVVRTDEVLAENIMYSSRASTSVFVGRPAVSRRDVRADAVTFDVTNEIASLDTTLGYGSSMSSAHVASITTDMGVHCQDLFTMYPNEIYKVKPFHDYIRHKIGCDKHLGARREPVSYLGLGLVEDSLPGLSHGQLATCEVIMTPVTADVLYFQQANSPRGRASCVVSCDAYSKDTAEKFLYDHSLSDPAHEYRSTVNPWASQKGSLGDVLYNVGQRQMCTPGMYSPCRQFFHTENILKNNRGFYTLITEYSNRLRGAPASSCTDYQYVVINGTDVFLEQPCQFFQEAYPTLSASHRAMLDEYMSHRASHSPVHISQYLIEEVAPVKRLFKLGNKIAY